MFELARWREKHQQLEASRLVAYKRQARALARRCDAADTAVKACFPISSTVISCAFGWPAAIPIPSCKFHI